MLGLDFANIYGGRVQELQHFRSNLTNDGVLILAEPVWLETPVPKKVLEALGTNADSFVTVPQMKQLFREVGFEEMGLFLSSKEDWELYVRPM